MKRNLSREARRLRIHIGETRPGTALRKPRRPWHCWFDGSVLLVWRKNWVLRPWRENNFPG